MASLGSYLPAAGSAVWRRDRDQHRDEPGDRIRHVVIRDAEIWEKQSPHVVYKIDVLTEFDHWYLFRRYSQFHTLHRKLVKKCGVAKDLLPPKKLAGNLSKALIDKRRLLLESYLQKLIHRVLPMVVGDGWALPGLKLNNHYSNYRDLVWYYVVTFAPSEPRISQAQELIIFLDVPAHDVVKVADILTRHLFTHGDRLLEEATPIALSVNEMYSITRRLRLPRDPQGTDPADIAADPAHLYGFVQQLERLRVTLPPPPISVSCMPFELAPFRSLHSLKLEGVPLAQVSGLVAVQQQLVRLSVHRVLRSLREIVIESVEEKRGSPTATRPPPAIVEGWRLSAMAKLTDNRVVVQPWHELQILSLSHNQITHLDDSFQILPALRELNLNHNLLQVLDLQYLCLPSLEKLSVSHNALHKIADQRKVLERVSHLNLSHNRLHSLEGLHAFVAVEALNISYNLVASKNDLNRLAQLRWLKTLTVTGNPIASSPSSRIVLLAKFMHKARNVTVDGQETTVKEQAKITSLREQYGTNPDSWPLAKSLASSSSSEEQEMSETPPGVQLCWQVQSPQRPAGWRVLDQSVLSEESFEQPLLAHGLAGPHGMLTVPLYPQEEEYYAVGSLSSFDSYREEPDGQSDIMNDLPETLLVSENDPPSSHSLTPPPSTPLTTNGNNKPQITPAMIRSALEALQHIQNKETPISLTPHDDTPTPIFPEAITLALTAWITSQSSGDTPLVSPPPSTPTEACQDRAHRAISASDLIAALSALIHHQEGQGSGDDSAESSVPCSVPSCTPQEGLSEWLKLGIRPEEVIQALSALTIAERGESLSPISEERSSVLTERGLDEIMHDVGPGKGSEEDVGPGKGSEEDVLYSDSHPAHSEQEMAELT